MPHFKQLDYYWACDANGLQRHLHGLRDLGKISGVKQEVGADREQWFICFGEHDYVIFVEHLAESAWFEMVGGDDPDKLQFFYIMLVCHTLP